MVTDAVLSNDKDEFSALLVVEKRLKEWSRRDVNAISLHNLTRQANSRAQSRSRHFIRSRGRGAEASAQLIFSFQARSLTTMHAGMSSTQRPPLEQLLFVLKKKKPLEMKRKGGFSQYRSVSQ
jgi:hypothetical protein